MISHRLDNLVNFDKIHFVKNGEIKESGAYKSLYSDKNSEFSKL